MCAISKVIIVVFGSSKRTTLQHFRYTINRRCYTDYSDRQWLRQTDRRCSGNSHSFLRLLRKRRRGWGWRGISSFILPHPHPPRSLFITLLKISLEQMGVACRLQQWRRFHKREICKNMPLLFFRVWIQGEFVQHFFLATEYFIDWILTVIFILILPWFVAFHVTILFIYCLNQSSFPFLDRKEIDVTLPLQRILW